MNWVTMSIIGLVGVLLVLLNAISPAVAGNRAKVMNQALNVPVDSMPFVSVSWKSISIGADLPPPFNHIKITIHRRYNNEDFDWHYTKMAVKYGGHVIHVKSKVINDIVASKYPQIHYNIMDCTVVKMGVCHWLPVFYITVRYGYPLDSSQYQCVSAPTCTAYPVARFKVDKNYNVVRMEDVPLIVGHL